MEGKKNDGKKEIHNISHVSQLLDGEEIYHISQLFDGKKIYNVSQIIGPPSILEKMNIRRKNLFREPAALPKKAPSTAAKKGKKAVNAARQAGIDIETAKKYNTGTNKVASSGTSLNTKKLDEDTENVAHDRVPTELKKAIMQARMEKKLTQAQLAQMINEKPRVIQEYESGKAIPNQQIMSKLERALGTKLRGKK